MPKYRLDFVTNSSSSSYTCDVCGNTDSGWDLCLSDAGMCQCVNNHTFCQGEMKTKSIDWRTLVEDAINRNYDDDEKEREKLLRKTKGMNEDDLEEMMYDEFEFRHDVPAEACPICSFECFNDNDVVKYLFKKSGLNNDQLRKEIKEVFKNYDEFKTYLNKK